MIVHACLGLSKNPNYFLGGCMKGPQPLHIFIRSGGVYAARSGPSGRYLYHFPAVTKGDRKMMQLMKMKNSFS